MLALRTIVPLLIFTICGLAQDVRYNYAAGENFAQYKTYKWVQLKGADRINQLAEQQLIAAVDAELAKKGLARTEGDNADLLVAYQASLGQEKEFTSYNTDWGYGPGWGGGWYGSMNASLTTGSTSTIYVGQIGIDMYSAGEKKLVWRGTASKTLDAKAKPDKQKKNLAKAMAKLLKNFPPPIKKS